MRIARIARREAIYDASATAQTFPDGELFDISERVGGILENGEKEAPRKEKKMILIARRVILNLSGNNKRMLIK